MAHAIETSQTLSKADGDMASRGAGKKKVTGKGKDSAKPAAETTAPATSADPPSELKTEHKTEAAQKAASQIPKAALVDDDGKQDDELMARANAALEKAKPTLGDGVGIGGGGEMVTFTGPEDGKERTMPKNHM